MLTLRVLIQKVLIEKKLVSKVFIKKTIIIEGFVLAIVDIDKNINIKIVWIN